ncbi:MAG TPA: bifunctional phosphoribosylaminoimidazolecarboxamide formyltransferase/IMP cyclohydrolase [Candidatus Coproplasma excrementigallinarum]|uniref:Bifunctional purine biosynthesis protein PurH n=1 Tax=Candidatus Coproplasma excrementigallinarum TaxID=2840747 RepID=A0A9D1SJH1_9FIRM|nr:bifunctional phosphoribosylaminoimidazolecarboxamide formyltransferase/IMP cyclohydrolase [Candidatus Coproplasma excrementigallinarum]
MKKRALVSVSDKTGVVDFCKGLAANGFEIISTGGTAKALKAAGLKVIGISEITGFPECLDGRVKTLHPNVHAGLLAMRSNPEHMKQLEELGINTIDIVAVNLYPFKATLERGADFAECIENIDIGGPTMIRAAAKNYQDVAVIVDPADYGKVLEELAAGGVTLETKRYLQYKVFAHTAVYDSLISNYLAAQLGIQYPETITFAYEKAQDMRYGENPQQSAVFYKEPFARKGSLSSAKQLWGKELSYNNINDANGALELLKEFGDTPAVVACKHANPCGVGTGKDIYEAYMRAYNSDPVSVFGGILAINGTVDEATAAEINKIFIEIVMAPAYTEGALKILEGKKNIRLLQIDGISARRAPDARDMKKVYGGLLVQSYDECLIKDEDMGLFSRKAEVTVTTTPSGKQKTVYGLGVVTDRAPTAEEVEAMMFAWRVVKYTKSNAIVIGKPGRTTGIGMGQTNRIWAAQQAIEHAGKEAKGSVMASDAFFPFSDCVEAAAAAGITAIIQPGGSIRDEESIVAANKAGIAMVFVGERHFKH